MPRLPPKTLILEYDVSCFPFIEWFRDVLETDDLEILHHTCDVNSTNYYLRVKEYCARLEGRFPEIFDVLADFIESRVVPVFGAIVSRQILPTPRTHLSVNDEALIAEEATLARDGPEAFLRNFYFMQRRPAMFHRDRDYGLVSGSINLWVPLTRAFGTNSLWLGGLEGCGEDALPITLKPGQCLCFDGANRWHGVVWNTSGITRVGFDLRFYPSDQALYLKQLRLTH